MPKIKAATSQTYIGQMDMFVLKRKYWLYQFDQFENAGHGSKVTVSTGKSLRSSPVVHCCARERSESINGKQNDSIIGEMTE